MLFCNSCKKRKCFHFCLPKKSSHHFPCLCPVEQHLTEISEYTRSKSLLSTFCCCGTSPNMSHDLDSTLEQSLEIVKFKFDNLRDTLGSFADGRVQDALVQSSAIEPKRQVFPLFLSSDRAHTFAKNSTSSWLFIPTNMGQ